ncbi:sensor histidine kinase [Inhella crocodyli]|nr:histidine kinase [Inhella crocodyli]
MNAAPHPLPWHKRHPRWADFAASLGVGTLVGLLIYLMRGRHFWVGMLYAQVISLCIGTAISLLQHGVSRVLLRSDPDNPQLRAHWPGWRWMVPCILLGALVGHESGTAIAAGLMGHEPRFMLAGTPRQLLFGAGFTLLMSAAATLFFYNRERVHALEVANADQARLVAQAQLTALQAQLEPHMLFNTLAHLRALIKLRPDDAQAMLDELIAYLRATLTASRTPLHPLGTEFARLHDYLRLMQRRMGPRLQVDLQLPPALAQVAVPPLLLQPLVENAIQHGLEPAIDGGTLRLLAREEGAQLVLTVEDDGSGLGAAPASQGTGFGTQQVRDRLATQYGDAARLDLAPLAPHGCRATVTLPLPPTTTP